MSEKEALENLARQSDLTVGQLVRRAIAALVRKPEESTAVAPPRREIRRVPDINREQELHWLSQHVDELAKLSGHWVVIEADELVAHGTDYVQVVAIAREAGVAIPFAIRIPDQQFSGAMMGL